MSQAAWKSPTPPLVRLFVFISFFIPGFHVSLVVGNSVLVESSLSLLSNTSVAINGNLTIDTAGYLFVEVSNSNSSQSSAPINVDGCVNFDGALNISVPLQSTEEANYSVVSYSCRNGTFATVNVFPSNPGCEVRFSFR